MRMLISDEKSDLEGAFERAREARWRWQKAAENQDERASNMADLAPGRQLGQMLFGSALKGRFGGGDGRGNERDSHR